MSSICSQKPTPNPTTIKPPKKILATDPASYHGCCAASRVSSVPRQRSQGPTPNCSLAKFRGRVTRVIVLVIVIVLVVVIVTVIIVIVVHLDLGCPSCLVALP